MPKDLTSMPDALATGAGLLKRELLLGTEALRAVAALQGACQADAAGSGVPEAAGRLEGILRQMAALAQKLQAFLQESGADGLAAFFAAQPPSPLRDGAAQLVGRAASQQRRLKRELAAAQAMVEKGKAFIDFHVNMLSEATAGNTYAPPGAAESEIPRGRQMFDANI